MAHDDAPTSDRSSDPEESPPATEAAESTEWVAPVRTEAEAVEQAQALLQSLGRSTESVARFAANLERLRADERARLTALVAADADVPLEQLRDRLARADGGLLDPRVRDALRTGVDERLALLVPAWRVALGPEPPATTGPTATNQPGEPSPLTGEEWHPRLESSLAEALGRAVQVHGSRRVSNGVSNLIFEVDVSLAGTRQRLCLRADGPYIAQFGMMAKPDERRVLALVEALGLPIIAPLALIPSPLAAGHALVTPWIEGESDGMTLVSAAYEGARLAMARTMAQTMAALHAVTPTSHPLPLPEHSMLGGGYDGMLAWVTPQDTAGAGFLELEVRAIHAWLVARRPPEAEKVLVHGDLRMGNVMVTADGQVKVLDWELTHWGDRHLDLAWATVPLYRFGHGARTFAGLCGLDELLGMYQAAGGAAVDPLRLCWWRVALCRWTMVICSDWQFDVVALAPAWKLPLGVEAMLVHEALRLIDAHERGPGATVGAP